MKLIITNLLVLLLMGCTTEKYDFSSNNAVKIYGNQLTTFQKEKDNRATLLLEEGKQASFYAKEGITAEGSILYLHQNRWNGTSSLRWKDLETPAQVAAYCPPLPYEPNDLYLSNGKLQDILVAKGNFKAHNPIELNFSHLFSKISFKIDPFLNRKLKELILTPHSKVTNIDPYSSNITVQTTNETKGLEVNYSPNSQGEYSIILPPCENGTIDIKIATQDSKILVTTLSDLKCIQGQCYQCKLNQKGEAQGISTAEDYIAFTHLINNLPYQNRSLEEFGKTENGRTTYFLKNDIHFTDAEKERVLQIADKTVSPTKDIIFNDIFDGQGFMLDNLQIVGDRLNNRCGLFQVIGTKGIVKNLIINNITNIVNKHNVGTSLFVCSNSGLIDNCHVRNSTMNIEGDNENGVINHYNAGIIINCSTNNVTAIISKNPKEKYKFSGITSYNTPKGKIMNCYSSNFNVIIHQKAESGSSCITYNNTGILYNCTGYSYDPQSLAICCINSNRIEHCFYPNQDYKKMKDMDGTLVNNYDFDEKNENSKNKVVKRLNEWAENTLVKKYPNLTFRTWKVDDNHDITFE